VLTRDQIKEIIPHAEPFVFIDAVTEMEDGARTVGHTDGFAAYRFFQDTGAAAGRPFSFFSSGKIDLDPAGTSTGEVSIADHRHLFEGHFPQQSVFPGALSLAVLVELAATAAGQNPGTGQRPFLSRIKNCRFRRPVMPSDTLRLETTVRESDESTVETSGRSTVEGEKSADARLEFDLNAGLTDPNANLSACVLIEAAAEVAAVGVLAMPEQRRKLAFLVGVQDWRFTAPVPLDKRIVMEAKLEGAKRGFWKGSFTTSTEDGAISAGEMLFFLQDGPLNEG
jgi:3-hydroxyacyl-[acyl-carrier-protein] dehydratase